MEDFEEFQVYDEFYFFLVRCLCRPYLLHFVFLHFDDINDYAM
jgi:hypothetical protein